MTWPNRITYSRILLVPIFAIAALQVRGYPFFKYIAVGLFVIIAIGDAIDGYVAVRLKQSTLEGKFIDPLADKLLMITACVFLALPLWGMEGGVPPLKAEIAIIIIARDILICLWVVVTFMLGTRKILEASRLGRITTFFQMLMLGTMLVGTIWRPLYTGLAVPLSYAAALLTIASGLHYSYKHGRRLFPGKDGA